MPQTPGSTSINNLMKARDLFEDFRKRLSNDSEKITAIHTFEFCFDLSLAVMREYMHKHGVVIKSNRHCLREAAIQELISDPEIWFEFMRKKVIGENVYKKRTANEVIRIFDIFSNSLDELIKNLSTKT